MITALRPPSVIYPALRRHGLDARHELAEQLSLTHDLERTLRQLHRRLHGDAAAAHLDLSRLRAELLRDLALHNAREEKLLASLRAMTSEEGWAQLLAAYSDSLRDGPTRPHPHGHLGGHGGRIAYLVLGALDRLLDVLDSRVVPGLPTPARVLREAAAA